MLRVMGILAAIAFWLAVCAAAWALGRINHLRDAAK